MKNIMLLVPMLAFFSIAICQRSNLNFSDDFKIAEKEYQGQIISHSVYHKDFFYTATNSGIGNNYKWLFTKLYDLKYIITVSKYDKNMKLIKTYLIENGDRQFGPLMPKLILINNKLALAYFQPNENKTSFSFYLALVDEENLTLKSPQKFCTIQQDNVGIFKLEGILKGTLVSFSYSPDKSKALVVCVGNSGLLQTYVIDDDLQILKQSDLRTPTTGFTISSAVLTNDNIECIVMESESGTKIVANGADKKKIETRLTPVGALKPGAASATASKDGKRIYICSTSSDATRDDKSCNGLLVYRLDAQSMVLSKPLSYPFTPQQLQIFSENGAGSKHKKEYSMFNFSPSITELKNGTIVILGCPQSVTNSTYTSGPNLQNQTHEISTTIVETGPIMAFYPDMVGKNLDYAFVPRKMRIARSSISGSGAIRMVQAPGGNQAYSDFIAANMDDEIMIIYDDVYNNFNGTDRGKIVKADSPKDLVLAEAMFGADKKLLYRKQIGENLNGRATYFLGNTAPSSTNQIIFPVAKQGVVFNSLKVIYTNWCFLGY